MQEDTACPSKQITNDAEAWGHNRTSEENYFVQDVTENIKATAPSDIEYTDLIQALDDIPVLPKFDNAIDNYQNFANYSNENTKDDFYVNDFDIDALIETRYNEFMVENDIRSVPVTEQEKEQHNTDTVIFYAVDNNQNIANYSNENTNDAAYVNDFEIDALIETRFNEFMVENDIRSVPLTEQENEQHNMDTVIFGEAISIESYNAKETLTNNSGSFETCATEVTNTNDALKISKATKKKSKKNKNTPTLKHKIEIKRNESKVEIEVKTVPKENVLSEFLNFNKTESVEALNSNVGEEKKVKPALIQQKCKTFYREIKYKCDLCDNGLFSYKIDLNRHIASKHGHECKECGFVADCRYRLKLHARRHTGEKPYQCHLCQYTCRRVDMLKRHSLTHTETQPYICHTCGIRFKSLKYLKLHVKNKCSRFSCPCCPMQYTSASDLHRHREAHESSGRGHMKSLDARFQCQI